MAFRVWCLYSYLVDDTVYIRTCMHSYNRLMRRQAYCQLPSITLLFTQKVVPKLSKYGLVIRDPEKPIPDPEVKSCTGPRIRIRNTEKLWHLLHRT